MAGVSGTFTKQLNLSDIPGNYGLTATQTSSDNTSEFSSPVGIPPAIPKNLSAIAGDRRIILSWDRNSDPDISHYNIYRDQDSPATTLHTSAGKDTFFVDTAVEIGTTYFYRIRAVDSSGYVSGFSDEINLQDIMRFLQVDLIVDDSLSHPHVAWSQTAYQRAV